MNHVKTSALILWGMLLAGSLAAQPLELLGPLSRVEHWSAVFLPSGKRVPVKLEPGTANPRRAFVLNLDQAPKGTTRVWLRPDFPLVLNNVGPIKTWRLALDWQPGDIPPDPALPVEELGVAGKFADGRVLVQWFSRRDWLADKYTPGMVLLHNPDYIGEVRRRESAVLPDLPELLPAMTWLGLIFPLPASTSLSFGLDRLELVYDRANY